MASFITKSRLTHITSCVRPRSFSSSFSSSSSSPSIEAAAALCPDPISAGPASTSQSSSSQASGPSLRISAWGHFGGLCALPPRTGHISSYNGAQLTQQQASASSFPLQIQWQSTPRTVLIIKKHNDSKTASALRQMSIMLHESYGINVLVEPGCSEGLEFAYEVPEEERQFLPHVVDFVVALGGDGTTLHSSTLFDQSFMPPVLSFHLGTLGFLMPFDYSTHRESIAALLNGQCTVMNRMRLHVDIQRDGSTLLEKQCLNEVGLHRGSSPFPATITCFVNDNFLTTVKGDGLLVATPTGSTGYSLAAGGSMVHPGVECMLLTPVCPMSLSFRPVILPSFSEIRLQTAKSSRSPPSIAFDGRSRITLLPEDVVRVRKSRYPMPTVSRLDPVSDWVHDVNEKLEFNQNKLRSPIK